MFVLSSANADIAFDETLRFLTTASMQSLDNKVLTLLKWGISGENLTLSMRSDMQDTWIFCSPIANDVAEQSDFMLGVPRCDNRLAQILFEANYSVVNPAFNLRSIEIQRQTREGTLYNVKNAVQGNVRNVLVADNFEFN